MAILPDDTGAICLAEHAIRDEETGQVRVSGATIVAKSQLDIPLHKKAFELLTRAALGFEIKDPTSLFLSAEIARRIYGPDCGDSFTLDPCKVSGCWPECLGKDISRLEQHEQTIVRESESLLRLLLFKVADDDGTVLARFLPKVLESDDKTTGKRTGHDDADTVTVPATQKKPAVSKDIDAGGHEEEQSPYRLIPPSQFQWKSDPPITLTAKEWRLLERLLDNPRSHVQDLIDAVWGAEASGDTGKLDTTLTRLRKKLMPAMYPVPITLAHTGDYVCLTFDPI